MELFFLLVLCLVISFAWKKNGNLTV